MLNAIISIFSEVMKAGTLKAPQKYQGDADKYLEFVEDKIKFDDEEEDPRAPAEWFNRVSALSLPRSLTFFF